MTNRVLNNLAAIVAATVGGMAMASAAHAATILTFGQTANVSTVSAVANAADTQTTITGADIAVTLSQYAGGGAPLAAYLNLDLASDGPAQTFAGQVLQPFSGTATFTSAAGGGGTDYLSASFTDFVFGAQTGSSLTLSASEPPGTVSFASDILPASELADPRALSFGFADVTGPVAVVGSTLAGFTSSISGTVSAASAVSVPEPASLAIMGAGLLGMAGFRRLGMAGFRRRGGSAQA